ncbi:MAG: hypothetical protein JXB29_10305 [Sedimentisphaerales bacterium]|nr:hypothetical protein [Sedimentisphaerales bacterium]
MKSKYAERILVSCVIFLGGLIGNVNASNPGDLKIKNHLNSYFEYVNIYRDDVNFGDSKNGIDNNDNEAMNKLPGYPNIYSDIITHKLWDDFRTEDSNVPYNIKLSFNGTLTENKTNWLEFSFPYPTNPFGGGGDYTFGDKAILYQSDRLPYGSVVDVRRAIANNGGNVSLIDVPAGTYNQWIPY